MKKFVTNTSIITLLLSVFIFSCKNTPKEKPLSFISKTVKDEIKKDSSNYLKVDIQYLEAIDGNPQLTKSINDTIQREIAISLFNFGEIKKDEKIDITNGLISFKSQYAEEEKMRMGENGEPPMFNIFEYEVSCKEGIRNDKTTSIMSNHYIFTNGAHGMNWSSYYVFDNKTGSEIPIESIVTNKEIFVNLIEEYFKLERKNDLEDPNASLEENGMFVDENTKKLPIPTNFILNSEGKGVDFVYNQYEAAAYAFGPTFFTIPFEKLTNCVDLSKLK